MTLWTFWSLELGSGPRGECVLVKTSRLGSYKPPLLPDIWGCLAGLRLNACWVVQHTGTLHTSGSGVNSLSISSIKEACFLRSKAEKLLKSLKGTLVWFLKVFEKMTKEVPHLTEETVMDHNTFVHFCALNWNKSIAQGCSRDFRNAGGQATPPVSQIILKRPEKCHLILFLFVFYSLKMYVSEFPLTILSELSSCLN